MKKFKLDRPATCTSMRFCKPIASLCVLIAAAISFGHSAQAEDPSATEVLADTGIQSGLAVHLGSSDGVLETGGLWVYSLDAATEKMNWKTLAQINEYTRDRRGSIPFPTPAKSNEFLRYEGDRLKLPGVEIDPKNPQNIIWGKPVLFPLLSGGKE